MRPGDLGFATDAELRAWTEKRLVEISRLISADIGRTISTDDEDRPIADLATQVAYAMLVQTARTLRDSSTVRVDEWAVQVARVAVYTPEVRTILGPLFRKGVGALGMAVIAKETDPDG